MGEDEDPGDQFDRSRPRLNFFTQGFNESMDLTAIYSQFVIRPMPVHTTRAESRIRGFDRSPLEQGSQPRSLLPCHLGSCEGHKVAVGLL